MTTWKGSKKTVALAKVQAHLRLGLAYWKAPPIPKDVKFTSQELFVSIARNLALSGAPVGLIQALERHLKELIRNVVDETGTTFTTTKNVAYLGDGKMIGLAHDIGAGIAGLLMEDMKYGWHCNGKQVWTSGSVPDYVWTVPNEPLSLVVSEVKGSIGPSVSGSALNSRARDGFHNQVVGTLGKIVAGTAFGEVVYGYGIGIHAPGGENKSGIYVHHPAFANLNQRRLIRDSASGTSSLIVRNHIAGLFRAIGVTDIADDFATGLHQATRDLPPIDIVRVEKQTFIMAPANRRRFQDGGRVLLLRFQEAADYYDKLSSGLFAEPTIVMANDGPQRAQSTPNLTVAWDGLALGRHGRTLLKDVIPHPNKVKGN